MDLEKMIEAHDPDNDFGNYLTEEMITHSLEKNTVECRVMVTIDAPDGSTWEGERVIRMRLKRK